MRDHNIRGINSCSFLCWMLCILRQKVSTKSLMAVLSDCFPSSSCLLYANIGNYTNIHIKETKKWLPFKTWCSLSVPLCTALPQRKLKLLKLVYWIAKRVKRDNYGNLVVRVKYIFIITFIQDIRNTNEDRNI